MRRSLNLPLICFVGVAGFVNQSLVYPVIPLYAHELGASIAQVGIIMSIAPYVMAVLMVPMGLFSDKIGKDRVLLGGLLVISIASFLYSFTADIVQIAAVRFFHGCGQSAMIVAALAHVIDMAPAGKRGWTMGWYTAFTQVGIMLGPFFGGLILNRMGYLPVYYTGSGVALAGLLVCIYLFGRIEKKVPASPLPAETDWRFLKRKEFFIAILPAFFVATGTGTLVAYMAIYGLDLNINEVGAGFIIAVSFAGSALVRVPAGMLADRLGRKPLIVYGLLLGAAAAVGIAEFHSFTLLSAAAFILGIGLGVVQPAALTLTADLAPSEKRGLAMGFYVSFFNVGNGLGPTVLGFVAQWGGYTVMFWTCAGAIITGSLLVSVLLRRRVRVNSTAVMR